jgi:hypothetical protein
LHDFVLLRFGVVGERLSRGMGRRCDLGHRMGVKSGRQAT